MRKITMKSLFILSVILSISCVKKPSKTSVSISSKKEIQLKAIASSSDTLTITAINLSEDMSSLSTKNDEVFVFIYDYSDTNELKAPLVSKKLIFDKNNPIHKFLFPNNENLILFFIEEDSFRKSIEIEPVVRIYFKELMKANTYNEVEKYLGEDDLLGKQIITKTTSSFTLSGRSSLDKFEYSFVLQ